MHEIGGREDGLEVGGLRGEVDIVEGDDAEERAVGVGDGEGLVTAGGELGDDFEEGVVGVEGEDFILGRPMNCLTKRSMRTVRT